jgi:hypothetical protein
MQELTTEEVRGLGHAVGLEIQEDVSHVLDPLRWLAQTHTD